MPKVADANKNAEMVVSKGSAIVFTNHRKMRTGFMRMHAWEGACPDFLTRFTPGCTPKALRDGRWWTCRRSPFAFRRPALCRVPNHSALSNINRFSTFCTSPMLARSSVLIPCLREKHTEDAQYARIQCLILYRTVVQQQRLTAAASNTGVRHKRIRHSEILTIDLARSITVVQ